MKCSVYRDRLLLLDSGELDALWKVGLTWHLRRCPICFETRQALIALRGASEGLSSVTVMPSTTRDSILQAARQEVETRRVPSIRQFRFWPGPAIGLAASILLVLGLTYLGTRTLSGRAVSRETDAALLTEWTDGVDLTLDVVDFEVAGLRAEIDALADVDEMARELMSMEGDQI